MQKSYGSIQDTEINQVLEDGKIQDLWKINKDEIHICKDCEYRYCCTDCRVFIDDSEDIYSRPSKCKYNPYQGLWEGQENYIEVLEWLDQNPKHV